MLNQSQASSVDDDAGPPETVDSKICPKCQCNIHSALLFFFRITHSTDQFLSLTTNAAMSLQKIYSDLVDIPYFFHAIQQKSYFYQFIRNILGLMEYHFGEMCLSDFLMFLFSCPKKFGFWRFQRSIRITTKLNFLQLFELLVKRDPALSKLKKHNSNYRSWCWPI